MSTELVERLRADVRAHEITGNGEMKRVQTLREAADELTALTAKVALLTEAMLNAAMDDLDWWLKPNEGEAAKLNGEQKTTLSSVYAAMLAAKEE
jgi:hypothetical protein